MIKKNKIKQILKSKKYRIGNKNLSMLIKTLENQINYSIEKITRNAKISGRKTIIKEDFN
jgi:histone H3/H4